MLQKNSFFSRPLIFFGPHHSGEEEDDDVCEEEEEWNFSDPWQISTNTQIHPQPKIGLFILWSENSLE